MALERKSFAEAVFSLCATVPKGKVTTYKEIALALNTRAYRAVGQALKSNPVPVKVPCHRVVRSDGTLGGYCGVMNSRKKASLLRSEGVEVVSGRIADFEKRLHRFGRVAQ